MARVRAGRSRQTRHRCFKCGCNWNGRGVHECAPTNPGGSVAALEELRLGISTLSRDLSSLSKTSVESRAISVLQDAVEVLRETSRAPLLRISRRTAAVAVLAGDLPRRRQGLRLVVPTRDLLASFGVPLDYTEEHSDHDR